MSMKAINKKKFKMKHSCNYYCFQNFSAFDP